MKRSIMFSLTAVLIMGLMASVSYAQPGNKMKLSAGDEVYACGCGEKCDCGMLSKDAGKCVCGADLVKAKVTKVEEGMATLLIDGKESTFKTTARYVCSCGSECTCVAISQKAGNCTCGMPMQEMK
jgi:hypothetical protein